MTTTTANLTRVTAERTIAAITGKTIATGGMTDERKILDTNGFGSCRDHHDRRGRIHVLRVWMGPVRAGYDMPCAPDEFLESGVTGEVVSPAAVETVPVQPSTSIYETQSAGG